MKSWGILRSFKYLSTGVGCRADRAEQEGHALELDQLARLLHCLGRQIAIVEAHQPDLAAVHAALVVDHVEEGEFALAERAVSGDRAAIGHGLADLDLLVSDSRRD